MTEPRRQRRSLTHVGGAITTQGDPDEAARLSHALSVTSATEDDEAGRAHVHGFHTYPARMHPDTAGRLIAAFSAAGERILDPFCGSGTVLIEALLAGRQPFGTDLNPLAVQLARCKTRPRSPEELERFTARARECAAHADTRRKAKAGASRRFPAEDVRLFEPHVLLELDSLRSAVETTPDAALRLDLALVLSSILVKLSRKSGDTAATLTTRRSAAGYAARLFVKKADDLAGRLATLTGLLPTSAVPAFVGEDDATKLRSLPVATVDAIITSPPYAATYDYAAHHELRLRWLGLDAKTLTRGEFGARTTYRSLTPREARTTWSGELARFLQAAARVLPTGRPLVLLMADSAVGTVALRADEIVAATAPEQGFHPVACASQTRPHFHGPTQAAFRKRPRAEHAILLRRR